ncbi:MAG: DUF1893 domain-containing protein [bacterium]|nr:MAG: DUF1893 domain-containing protein [bacterium]
MEHTLEVFSNGRLIFHSDRKWLHPLFELKDFLRQKNYDPTSLIVKDKIIGRAAALLQVYLGIRTVKTELMSDLGRDVLEKFEVEYEYEKLVERIQCRTEEMLKDEYDPEKAYMKIKKLAGK